jgi:hypothetical protein
MKLCVLLFSLGHVALRVVNIYSRDYNNWLGLITTDSTTSISTKRNL